MKERYGTGSQNLVKKFLKPDFWQFVIGRLEQTTDSYQQIVNSPNSPDRESLFQKEIGEIIYLLSSSPKSKGFGGDREGVGAAIFLLADQPQTTPAVLRALIEEHARTLAPIVAPLVQGQRTNPVLFDCLTFPNLIALSGDIGGRAIFSKFPVDYLTWHDEGLLSDVDTPEEYRKLVNGE